MYSYERTSETEEEFETVEPMETSITAEQTEPEVRPVTGDPADTLRIVEPTKPDAGSTIDKPTETEVKSATVEPMEFINPSNNESITIVEIPDYIYAEPNSSNLNMFSALGIPSVMYKKKSPNVDFLEPLSPIMFDTYGLEQNKSLQKDKKELQPYFFKYGHGSEFDFEKLKKEYESKPDHLPSTKGEKDETYELLKYDHYVAYRNRIIENLWVGSINDVFEYSNKIKLHFKKIEDDKLMAERCKKYTDAIRIINGVLKLRKNFPDEEFPATVKQQFIIAVKARQELVDQIPEEIVNKLHKQVNEASDKPNTGCPKTMLDVLEHSKLQKETKTKVIVKKQARILQMVKSPEPRILQMVKSPESEPEIKKEHSFCGHRRKTTVPRASIRISRHSRSF